MARDLQKLLQYATKNKNEIQKITCDTNICSDPIRIIRGKITWETTMSEDLEFMIATHPKFLKFAPDSIISETSPLNQLLRSSYSTDPSKNIVYKRTMPVKVVSEGNIHEHWTKPSKRGEKQKEIIQTFLKLDRPKLTTPCHIEIVRIAPRELDSDNLAYACKKIRDTLADYIHPGLRPGRADADKSITWSYSQRKGPPKTYDIVIIVTSIA